MLSGEYKALKKNVKGLVKIFFDYEQSFVEPHTDIDKQKYKAFVVLFHSEIEDYLEKMIIRILDEAEKRWNVDYTFNNVIATLITYYFRDDKLILKAGMLSKEEKRNLERSITVSLEGKERKFPDIDEIVVKIIERQKYLVNYCNHGIKDCNISDMLTPIGIDLDEFEKPNPEVIAALNDVSSQRGKFAHTSSVRRFDGYKSKGDFSEIVDLIRSLDKWLLEKISIF